MARRRHNDRTLYVVAWEPDGIVKIGFTDHLHRRRKAMPASSLILALTFPDSLVGYDFEIAANRAAFNAWPRAFGSRTDAIPFLPPFGRGYLECYQATPAAALELIASRCHVTFTRHDVTIDRDDTLPRRNVMSRSYGRTDGLTETGGFRDEKISHSVTRRRASRIFGFTAIGRAS